MAIVLSLLTAGLFGTADFLGGLAGRRLRILEVLVLSHLVGLVGVTAASVLIADEFHGIDLVWGAAGGGAAAIGVGLLYRGLARGPMGVVAPLTAVTSAAVPALWGVLVTEDALSLWSSLGVALALVAIGLVSWSRSEAAPVTPAVVAEALLAGAAFGAFFIVLDQTDPASAPWPIVGARLFTGGTLVIGFLAARRPVVPRDPVARRLVVGGGLIDTASNAMFLFANEQGSLTVVAVLSSLYPVTTVVLARLVLHERLSRRQQAGFVVAMAATALIAAG